MTAQARFVRRRIAALGVVVAACVLAVAVIWPALHHAVRDLTLPLSNASIIRQQASEKHLDPTLIAAVIFAESKFNPRTSPAGATGLMQLEPSTADFIARRTGGTRFTTSDLATPQVNIAYGSYYLRYLLDRYSGDVTLALAAYNGGESNVDSWLAQAHSRGDALTIDAIPFPETRAYVRRVLNAQQAYRSNYPRELGLS
jgi:soluble lytic murein transglycosylase